MLFAQAALALAACESLERTPALAFAGGSGAEGGACHEEGGANTNLCLAHCLAGDQTLDKPDVTVPPFAAVPVLALRPIDRLMPVTVAPRKVLVPPAAAPPPRILFRTLLI